MSMEPLTSLTPDQPLPHIVVLTTGGTIVSSGASATQMTGYSLQGVTVDELLRGVPGLADVARVSVEAVANIDSSSMTSAVWMTLAERVMAYARQDDVDGIVITHGTDTLEETAYFLTLTLTTEKPVVITGAMRPSTALSAEGPLNLLNAIRVATHPSTKGRGVIVALNDTLLSGRDATKTHPTNVATFRAPDAGVLGLIAGNELHWLNQSAARHAPDAPFPLPQLQAYVAHHGRFPRVDILTSHVDDDAVFVNAALAAGAQGLVHAGTGNGSIHEQTEGALLEAAKRGVLVVRASRTGSGACVSGLATWEDAGFIASGTLNPAKARVLLQLILMTVPVPPQRDHDAYIEAVNFARHAYRTC